MNDVNYLVGVPRISATPLPPYSDEACSFIAALSTALLRDPAAKQLPDVTSLAFWCRKGNITKLKNSFCSTEETRLGRGLTFHIAPANVPVNFAFSFLFSLLAGNTNIVRVPSKPFPQVEVICRVLGVVLKEHPEIAQRTALISYPADNEITAKFSAMADTRMIWGGDATVASVRALACKPRCIDVVFADRYSLCVLDGKSILQADDEALCRLAKAFYNDTYLMDQNACSSPQLICWLNASEQAKTRFWSTIAVLAGETYELQAAVAVDKYTQACADAARLDEVKAIHHTGNILYRAELSGLASEGMTQLRGTGGYFYECELSLLDELCPIVTEQFQTITYFGVQPQTLRRLITANHLRGIDRIVPVGSAMDIGVIWDGYDLVRTLSRIVHII